MPPTSPQARKYTANDVDMLPWSYTLSSVPTLLRDRSDNAISKVYTLPRTESLPYPPLPISFPNLALYLQTALDEARRYQSDSSTGVRKLAKMIDVCYPELAEDSRPENSGKRLLKKVIGRSGRSKNPSRGGNDNTYDLVTPFVPDQWG